jgi:hypothetical protein
MRIKYIMEHSLAHKLLETLSKASRHNSQTMTPPEAILWPDPERQWEQVIPVLQEQLPALLVLGGYDPAKRSGPAIWLKCMVGRALPAADWPEGTIPVLYLPGVSRSDFRQISSAAGDLQPLMEYQYTGTFFTQANGREWTVMAFMENPQAGLGLKVAQDNVTREALVKALPAIFQEAEMHYPENGIDSEFLYGFLFPNAIPAILKWLCQGERYMQSLPADQVAVFVSICRSRFRFEPDVKNVKAIAEQLGAQRNQWKIVWRHYADAPRRYPEIAELLRHAKPDDLGAGMFQYPEESWPQVNEAQEDELRAELEKAARLAPQAASAKLEALEKKHGLRRQWVWAELGQAPLAAALPHLLETARRAAEALPCDSLENLREYYVKTGYKVDQSMRSAFAAVKKKIDKAAAVAVIRTVYQPWLEKITLKFQELVAADPSIFTGRPHNLEEEEYILFVDALRYELAMELFERLAKPGNYKVGISEAWSAVPSLTPTAKPAVSPIWDMVSVASAFNEFRPRLQSGSDLATAKFRSSLAEKDVVFVKSPADIQPGKRHWQEIGDIDSKGHAEQAGMVRRIDELFEQVEEALSAAFGRGITRIRIVTDHGWLLLPGGLPKETLHGDLTETRWGRCALIKEGAKTMLLHLPWRWNPGIHIAYAPGIAFFKKNEEYAHGGISIQECLTPSLVVEAGAATGRSARIKDFKWVNLMCKIETIDAPDGYLVDIRTRYSDPGSSVVANKGKTVQGDKITLMADDDAQAGSATIVLMDEQGIILDKKPTLVGG